ncbi:LacI family transcriptional regulator [Zhengella mangrovi]|uniref:LacI family transcriptional regulator n=1 Tax=Zhengella mangrovi TaxID=1982044 RepID=A0A2G1QLD6_9HYPH|nr:LacI family DNA-binding transcriptional regulator [Zhengella mangrovi]PHP66336.1 LacI family transcriptional regulator [Zhengella mangrovi]
MASAKITDVARVAGVSTATVSRALNRPDTVAEDTRQAVMEAAARTGYRINFTAQNLRRGRTGAAMVLVPNLGNPFFSEILSGIEATLAKSGLSVLVADTRHPDVPASLLVDYLSSGRADGIISLDGSLPDTLVLPGDSGGTRALPPLIYACEWNETASLPGVRVDNRAGAAQAIAHLAGLGHVRIGHILGPRDNVLTGERMNGAIGELEARGLVVNPDWFLQADFSIAGGLRAAKTWLAMEHRPTAMFCASDELAFGFISGLHEAGIRVPQDVSVVGFDDIETARFYIPPLTTIRQPRSDLGAAAADLLLRLLEHPGTAPSSGIETLPVDLIVRASTAAPAA